MCKKIQSWFAVFAFITAVVIANSATTVGTDCVGRQVRNIALAYIGDGRNTNSGYVKVNNTSSEKKGLQVVVDFRAIHYLYQIRLNSSALMWFDPSVKRFICWDRHYTKLIPRRLKLRGNFKDFFDPCTFTQNVSDTNSDLAKFYTKYYTRHNGRQTVLKFNTGGKHPKNLEECHVRHKRKRCGYANFLEVYHPEENCNENRRKFCDFITSMVSKRYTSIPQAFNFC